MSDSLNNLTALLDSLSEGIDNTSVEFDEFGNTLSKQEAKAKQIESARQAAIDSRIAKENEEFNKKVRRYHEMTKFAVDTASSMTTQEGAFNTLADLAGMAIKGFGSLLGTIPVFGAALKGLSEGVADAVKLIASETAKAFQTFGKLSDSGIISNFEDMKQAARNTGLLFGELDIVLAKNSQTLALLGGTALKGSKQLQQILNVNNVSSEKYAEQFQKIGMSFAEFSEIQASYVSQQIKAGSLKNKSDQTVAKNARDYALNLDTLSKLTGKQRKEIQKEQEKLESNARFRAYLVELESQGPEGERKAQVLRDLYSVIGEGAREGLMDIVVSGGAITTDAAAQVAIQLGQGGLDVVKFAKDFERGAVTTDSAMNQLSTAADKYKKEMSELTMVIGPGSDITKGFVNMANLAQYAGKNFKEAREIFEKERKALMDAADPMAEAGKKSHDIAREVEDLLTKSKGVPAALDAMAGGALKLGKLIEGIVTKFGGTVTNLDQSDAETARLQRTVSSTQDTQQTKIVREETQQALQEAKEHREQLEKEFGRDSDQAKKARIEEYRKQQEAQRANAAETSAGRKKYSSVTGQPTQAGQAAQSASQPPSQAGRGMSLPTTQPATMVGTTPATKPQVNVSEKLKLPTNSETASGSLSQASTKTVVEKSIAKVLDSGPGWLLVQTADGQKQKREGVVAWRTNNPGNLRSTPWTRKQPGYVGEADAGSSGKFAVFETEMYGKLAKQNLFFSQDSKYIDLSIKQAISRYAPETDNNLTQSYIRQVASGLGLSDETILKNLDNTQRARMIDIINQVEGGSTKQGKITQAAKGALINPKTGGTLVQVAEAGQPEAIIPMPDGRTIPVTITNKDDTKLSGIFQTLNSQVEQIADLLMRGNSIEDNLAQIMT